MSNRVLALLLLLLATAATCLAGQTGTVSWIYDGDTLKIENIGKVRLLGIDAPETENSPRDNFYTTEFGISRQRLRSIARQAKRLNIELVKGKPVRLEFDRQRQDKYGRTLAYAYLPDGRLLNLLLLEKGLVSVFRRYQFDRREEFLQAEKTARSARLGLWQP